MQKLQGNINDSKNLMGLKTICFSPIHSGSVVQILGHRDTVARDSAYVLERLTDAKDDSLRLVGVSCGISLVG